MDANPGKTLIMLNLGLISPRVYRVPDQNIASHLISCNNMSEISSTHRAPVLEVSVLVVDDAAPVHGAVPGHLLHAEQEHLVKVIKINLN